MAATEREFLEHRLWLVEKRLGSSESVFAVGRDGEVSREGDVEHGRDVTLQRERRMLYKMLDEVPEGRVLEAIRRWRAAGCGFRGAPMEIQC